MNHHTRSVLLSTELQDVLWPCFWLQDVLCLRACARSFQDMSLSPNFKNPPSLPPAVQPAGRGLLPAVQPATHSSTAPYYPPVDAVEFELRLRALEHESPQLFNNYEASTDSRPCRSSLILVQQKGAVGGQVPNSTKAQQQ